MNIIRITGGLGNQMFQYAFSRSLINEEASNVQLDLSSYSQKTEQDGIDLVHNGFELERVFGIPYTPASIHDVNKLSSQPTTLFKRLRRKYFTKKTQYIDKTFSFDSKLLSNAKYFENRYYDGYWQSEKYFSQILDEIRKFFTFKPVLSKKNIEILQQTGGIANLSNLRCSIHIRRGDYLNSENLNVCTKQYYQNALTELFSRKEVLFIFVFSDDITWCKNELELEKYINNFNSKTQIIYVDWNKDVDSWQDMYLMSMCTTHIIANSSFSWWGAWLDNSSEKLVFAPRPWNMRELHTKDSYYHHNYSDIVPDSWIRVPIF